MEPKIQKQLEEAKTHFYSWRMAEAYAIFRRFFDRLPFKPEKEHGEYIAMFVRVLGELGKMNELKFYVGELEKIADKRREPSLLYTLAFAYYHLDPPRAELMRRILDDLLKDPAAEAFHVRAKMALANYYDRFKSDSASCRRLMESIGEVGDPVQKVLVDIWWAKILRDECRYSESEERLRAILEHLDPKKDWYGYFSAKLVAVGLYLKMKNLEKATGIAEELRNRFGGKQFKTIQSQIQALVNQIERESRLGPVELKADDNSTVFTYVDRSLVLKKRSAAEVLLLLLVQKRFLDKSLIIKNLYDREYDSKRDDKLVYYHIHSLRKRLGSIGVPSEMIRNEGDGYRFVAEVEATGGERWA